MNTLFDAIAFFFLQAGITLALHFLLTQLTKKKPYNLPAGFYWVMIYVFLLSAVAGYVARRIAAISHIF